MNIEDRLRDALKTLIDSDPPPGLVERSVADLPPRRPARIAWLRTARAMVAAGLAVVVVTAVVGSALLLRPDRNQQGVAAVSPSDVAPNVTERASISSVTEPPPSVPTATEPPPSVPTATEPPPSIPTETEPVSSSPPETQPPPSATATGPTPTLDADARSDRYWESVSDFAPYSLTYDSLGEITREVHLVVRGRLVGMTTGVFEAFDSNVGEGPWEWTFTVVEIDEVLKGEPVTKVPGTVEVALADQDEELPDDEVILFLMNHARQRAEGGYPPASDPDDIYHYERPNGYQAVLRKSDGLVEIIQGPRGAEEAFGPFPWNVDGLPFEEVADRIRESAQESE